MNRDEIEAFVVAEEPDYRVIKDLDSDAVTYLGELVGGDDVMLAAKATYMASLSADETCLPVLEAASQSPHPEVRVAAVDAARNFVGSTGADAASGSGPNRAKQLLEVLEEDEDEGVRRAATVAVRGSTH